MTCYFLSGLGADKRIFDKLQLPEGLQIIHIQWIPPYGNESLANYAKRLSVQINTAEPFQLLGVSFGGIIATELSKIIKPQKIIIISSVATSKQLPFYFRFCAQFLLNPLIPAFVLKSENTLKSWIFGADNEEKKIMFNDIMQHSDIAFLKWAIEQLTTWESITRAKNLFHIHGTQDKLFPLIFVKPDFIIEGGGHLMVYDRAVDISEILRTLFATPQL
jgi:pimeloyl-ACP methyl ester carboxylesterase